MGVPFMPVRGVVGTDYLRVRPDFKTIRNPYGDDDIVIVPAIVPDVAIFHAFRADKDGNVATYGEQNNWLVAQAAKKVIVTAEEIVESDKLLQKTTDTIVSWIHVNAVVHTPGGAHPTSCRGYYGEDIAHIKEYIASTKDDQSFQQYLDRYVRLEGGEESYRAQVNLVARGGRIG